MPLVVGQPIFINRSNALVAAGKFLRLKEDGQGGLNAFGLSLQTQCFQHVNFFLTLFTKTVTRSSLASLASSDSFNSQGNSMQAVSSKEVSPTLSSLLDRVGDLP
ncbi:hypothetical protein DAPPUDRAFT_333710 [Daphnia pulex]|uniref:Uncharacterized protein n=1 Tax=Daphnia pulex TaxID=6669 RepID=E9HTM5_DAPPU|nr:hypothetical protein DAPPUDRAFT_333710 [Daphnia pulex]|eukprot:EFX64900.1 hypothetical protein DAPPUDRAFT_333710 [Daphnia pulex]